MEVEIVKIDNEGKGIGYINNKIIFVPKTTIGDIVNVKIINDKKNYQEGIVVDYVKKSRNRIDIKCPFYYICGGCDLMHINYSDQLEYKLNTINEILEKNNIFYKVENIFKSNNLYNYRNKVSLKIVNGEIGYYENNTHDLVKIDYCYLCNECINEFIKEINLFNIFNGEIIIRSNYKNELSVCINTKDKIENIDLLIDKYKIVELVINNKLYTSEDFILEKIDNYLFKVSSNSFFQVNEFITNKLFSLIFEYTKSSNNILDLYCGVGTLSIVASKNAQKVVGVELVDKAIENANFNAKINGTNNIEFICDDTKNIINLINKDFDTIILDPPRSGINEKVINKIKEEKINKIIYVSCNPITFVRDMKLLIDDYDIENIELLDMFPNTHHIETFCVLNKI